MRSPRICFHISSVDFGRLHTNFSKILYSLQLVAHQNSSLWKWTPNIYIYLKFLWPAHNFGHFASRELASPHNASLSIPWNQMRVMLWHKNLFIFYCVLHLVIDIYVLMALCWFISIYLKFSVATKPTSQMLTTMSALISPSAYLLRELKNPNWRHGIVWELDFSWKTPKIR